MTSLTFFIYFVPILSGILLGVNLLLAPHNPYEEKKTAFECGFHSFLWQNRIQFAISFFIFALLFLLFDLEILLIYPYSVSQYTNEIYGLTIMIIFFILLTIGFSFEFGKKGLRIDSRQLIRNNYLSKVKDKFIVSYKNLSSTNVNYNMTNNINTNLSKPISYTIMGISFIFWYDSEAAINLINNWMNSINLVDVAKDAGLNGKEISYPNLDWSIPKTMAEYKFKMSSGLLQLPHTPFFHAPDNLHYMRNILGISTPILATILAHNIPNVLSSVRGISNTISNGWASLNSSLEILNYFLARNYMNITVFLQPGSNMPTLNDGDSEDESSDDMDLDEMNAQNRTTISETVDSVRNQLREIRPQIIATLQARFSNEQSFSNRNRLIRERIEDFFTSDYDQALAFYVNFYSNIFRHNPMNLPSETANSPSEIVRLNDLMTYIDFDILNGYSLVANSINSENIDINSLIYALEDLRVEYMIYRIILNNIR